MTNLNNNNNNEAKELAAASAIVRGYVGDVPAEWAVAVANDEAPPLVSDNHRWYEPLFGRDPTTGRALNADGTPFRGGRPPGAYMRNGTGCRRSPKTGEDDHRTSGTTISEVRVQLSS